MLATTAALAGVLVIFGVFWVLNAPEKPPALPGFRCDSTSPDDLYRCALPMAHNGWCGNGDIEWRYESWAIGADDNTRAAPEPNTEAVDRQDRQRRIPRGVFWLGILLVAGIANFQYDTKHQTAPPPQYDCDWQVTKCVNWERR